MEKAVRAFGAVMERAGASLQTVTGDDILWLGCVILVLIVGIFLAAVWTAIFIDWWKIAGRYRVSVFLKDRAAELREWHDIQARLKRIKRVYRANFNRR